MNRVIKIEGEDVLVVERTPPLPPTLNLLLEGGRDPSGRLWAPLRVVVRHQLQLGGARPECERQEHRLGPWLEGFHTGADGIGRSLRLLACRDCGAICIRDATYDSLPGLPPGARGPGRRNLILGWYTGARPNQRIYT